MIEMTVLEESKQTERKVRWDAYVDGAPFSLYIPKWRVPEPWPRIIQVSISPFGDTPATHLLPAEALDHPLSRRQRIVTHLSLVSWHTKTIRYRPDGDDSQWETGEPYIPIAMTFEGAERLTLTVDWQK
jgi:hypothetical protein